MKRSAGCLLGLLWLGTAMAADPPKPATPVPVPAPSPAPAPAPSAAAAAPTLVHLSESAERQVPRDEFVAVLAAEATDADSYKVQDSVNQAMTKALAAVKEMKSVAAETSTYLVHGAPGDKGGWEGSQQLDLTSRDGPTLMILVASLQDQGLVVKQLNARLSREAQRRLRDELADEALRRLRLRAEHISQTLDARIVRYSEIQVGGDNVGVEPRMFAASIAAPALEAGDSTVSITVSATVEMALRRP